MTAVWIILAALLAVVLLGTVLFLIACRRGAVPDLTKPEVIAKWGRAEQTEEILAGVSRLAHQARNLVLVTNEIFSDGYRYEEETMEYQRILGNINVRLAEMADCVTEVVYGIPVRIKKE